MDLNEMLKKAIDSIKSAVQADEMLGKPVYTSEGMILPVCKLSYGFVVGGGEYGSNSPHPYAGASGGGVTVEPLGFLLCGSQKRFISVSGEQPSKWSELLRAAINTVRQKDE